MINDVLSFKHSIIILKNQLYQPLLDLFNTEYDFSL